MGEIEKALRAPSLVSLPEALPATGLICCVASDETSSLYFTDEFNHSVVALDPLGALRWHRSAKGSDHGKFHYPRGLSLGRVTLNGIDRPCLAVSDAWNGRIQFLDLDGKFLTLWSRAGRTALSEPSDVRFIETGTGQGSGGSYWLVLDSGNHRLCALDKNGSLLFQIGRGWPPAVRCGWAEPQLLSWGDFTEEEGMPEYMPYDGLYYPERILGSTEESLFLWEPSSKTCQLVADGNTLPFPVGTYPDGVWIAADHEGMAEWSPSRSSLCWHGPDGMLLDEMAITGRPVPSNLPSTSVWIQEGRKLTRVSRREGAVCSGQQRDGLGPLLLQAAAAAMRSFNPNLAQESVGSFRIIVREMMALDRLAAKIGDEAGKPSEGLTEAGQRIEGLFKEFQTRALAVAQAGHPICLAALELRLAALRKVEIPSHAVFSQLRDTSPSFLSPLRQDFLDIVAARDELEVRRAQLSSPQPRCSETDPRLLQFLGQLQGALNDVKSWLCHWCAPSYSHFMKSTNTPVAETTSPPRGIDSLVAFDHRSRSRKPRSLTEIARIRFKNAFGTVLAGPLYLTPSPAGGFFASFFMSGHVVEVTPDGCLNRLVGTGGLESGAFQGPAGLAVDERKRLWIAEATAGQIRIIDAPYDGPGSVLPSESDEVVVRWPVGLCSWPKAVIVADPRGNQLVRISLDGHCDVLLNRAGHGPGEIRCPNSFCRDDAAEAGVWLVDKLNHRLQHFDSEWRATQQLGRCGFGGGELLYPLALGVFPDGTVIVSQEGEPWALKLLRESGEEIETLLLDYSPGGVLVHAHRIYVAAINDNSVRVYERS